MVPSLSHTSNPANTTRFLKKAREAILSDQTPRLIKYISACFLKEKIPHLLALACEQAKSEPALFLLEETRRQKIELNPRVLVASAFGGDVSIIEKIYPLVKNFPFIDAIKEEALVRAASQGHVEMVKYLIPLVKGKQNRSNALAWASHNGHLDVVKVLAPKACAKFEKSIALQWAFKNGKTDILDVLLPLSDVEVAIEDIKKKWGNDPIVLRELKAYNEKTMMLGALNKKKKTKLKLEKPQASCVVRRKM